MTDPESAARPDYGIDAPGVIRGLTLGALLALALAGAAWAAGVGWAAIVPAALGAIVGGEAALMLRYARRGKFRHRDRILAEVPWRGNEHVLDIGTGRGLLLVGAARRLASGRALGIDIWSTKDLSGNSLERTRANLAAEGVADRVELRTERAEALSGPDGSFDVVLSNLCLHNIASAAGREQACREIARVLRPGGIAVIADLFHTRSYAAILRAAGLTVERKGPYLFSVFPPQYLVVARK